MSDNSDFTFLIQRLDKLHSEILGRMDGVQSQVSSLTAIVTNGLSHRTTETEQAVKEIRAQMATREELTAILSDRREADKAWKAERHSRRKMWTSLIVGPVIGGLITLLISNL